MEEGTPLALIPREKLVEGFDKCRDLVSTLLTDSETLYKSGNYTSSIVLSILAHEEISKLNIIWTHVRTNSGISKEEWNKNSKPGSHTYKGTSFYGIALDELKKMGEIKYDQIVAEEKINGSTLTYRSYHELLKQEEHIRNQLKTLNEIKKACLYLDWKNCDWFKISEIYSTHELRLLSEYLLDFVRYELFSEILDYKYPFELYHTLPVEINVMKNDPIWIQREEYSKTVYGDEGYKKFLDAINYMIDTFPQKSFKFIS
jgi:AbiV family abortive infection protein